MTEARLPPQPLRVTALAASAQLGGTERVLLDFAARAFEHDIALRVLAPRDGPLIALLNEIGVPAEVVPAPAAMLRGSQQPGRLWSAIPSALMLPVWGRALRAHAFSRDAQVFYSIGFKTHLMTAFPSARRVVWHLHEFPPATTGWLWRGLARSIPDTLIANSAAVAKAWDAPSKRLAVIHNGVDLDRFKPREPTRWIHRALGLSTGDRLVGMPAAFARWKGHEAVIEAFRTIMADFPNVHLVFVGGSIYDTVAEQEFGETLQRITSEGSRASGDRRIHLLPFQERIELTYPEFDVAVHYSLRPEPFGRVILEAMACGIPVLAADEGGPIEILGTDPLAHRAPLVHRPSVVGGWLVPARNTGDLAMSLARALSLPPAERSKIGQLGRVRAEDHFSARTFAKRVAEVLSP